MKKKMYCFECNEDVDVKIIKGYNTYNIHGETIEVCEETYICPKCNNELLDGGLTESLYNIYNQYLDLFGLSFQKLKDIRKSLNLSQDLFAKALGWSKRSVIRYENADSLPQKQCLQTYQKLLSDKNEFIKILNSNRESLGTDVYYKIFNQISTDLDLKTINTFLYLLDNNYLTKTQIMKNMFSIDFQSYKENNKAITSLIYAHGTYGPIIDKKDAYLNILTRDNYLEMIIGDDDVTTFKPIQKCDLSLFSKYELRIMDKVKKQLKGKSSSKLTEWTHKFKGWIDTSDGEIIDFSYSTYFDLMANW